MTSNPDRTARIAAIRERHTHDKQVDLQGWRREIHQDRACLLDVVVAQAETIRRLEAEIDAAWFGIEHGYDIESRAELEAQSQTNGFRFGLAQDVHHIWKREPKVRAEAAQAEKLMTRQWKRWKRI